MTWTSATSIQLGGRNYGKWEIVSNTAVIENADSKTQVLDLVEDMAYVAPEGRHLIGDPNS